MNKQYLMSENRSIGLKCNKYRCGKGEGLPKYLHEKAIWPKCHFGTLTTFSWTRQLVSTASKPSKGERVMVGNGSTAVAGRFIDRMDLTLPLTLLNGKQQNGHIRPQRMVACDTVLESASILLSYERDSKNFLRGVREIKNVTCARCCH